MSEVYETIGYLVLGVLIAMWLTKIAKCSLRDYFAAKAMQSFIGMYSHEGDVSRNAYKFADAMLKARME